MEGMSGKVNRDLFYKLASELGEERLQAAVSIIQELSALKLPDHTEEWNYVLGRLIKGLSSDRTGARLGFSLCLTEVINLAIDLAGKGVELDSLSNIDQYLTILSETLSIDAGNKQNNKKMKGKDERGLLFGKMFGLKALLNEPLFSKTFLPNKKVASNFCERFMVELLDLASRKNWIREPCLFTLFQTVEKLLPFADFEFIKIVLGLLDDHKFTLTNEGLAIYLLLLHKGPEKGKEFNDKIKLLVLKNSSWKLNDPLARGNLPRLTQVLRESSLASEEKKVEVMSANWQPRLHFVWDILLPTVSTIESNSDEKHMSKRRKKNKGPETNTYIRFPEFWQMTVDESFFNEKASSERKYLGFSIFERAISIVQNPLHSETCFSQNFMRSLINQSSDASRLLHKISTRVMNTIVKACEESPSTKLIPVIHSILFATNGSTNFDKLTKSKTVSKLISITGLTLHTLLQLFDMLTSQIKVGTSEDFKKTQFILDSLLHIVRSHKQDIFDSCTGSTETELIIKHAIAPLVRLAFFAQTDIAKKEDESDNQVDELAKERLFSVLSELTTTTNKQLHSWQYYTLLEIIDRENENPNSLINKMDDDLKTVRDNAIKVIKGIASKNEKTTSSGERGLESLLSMCLLQLYSGDADSVATIEELITFYNASRDVEEKRTMVGITEILLSLLAQKKAVLKKLSLLVWEQFVSEIDEDVLNLLLDVLPARENKQGFAELFENADEYEEDDEEENEYKEENESDDESSSDDEDDEEGDEDDEGAEGGNEAIAKIDKEATSALAKALNLPDDIINENGEVNFDDLSDGSDISSDEESLDDEKMMELDDQLAEIFKRRKEALSSVSTGNQRKIEVKESRESVIAFKHRVFDLLSIYIKHAEDSELPAKYAILFIEPMMKCVQQTLDKSLADKISKLLKTKVYKLKTKNMEEITAEQVFDHMTSVHETLLTSKPGQYQPTFYSLCSSTSIFLSKLLLLVSNDKEEAYGKIVDIYSETTKKWVLKDSKFGSNIFIDFYNWLSSKKSTK
ncbi:hypothetical protein KAFR_0L00330 [Kazachstania africana CBS 2517]|uniref:DNA polymerase V n=1 Tax=Kazachstania africana (strain ATCC 22294 / BCRC 22015 / CBS 2517 / CECT 1963 / NBRC 1671 / NRRL Y-8276) TaxID=1071382 RepID=H2B1Z0_KAZAF|nr:hypothetical protein KAFR_0L00330 [Kazachstania africana CBS 2517]CCF60640.1 hypothetical protein KAFR_0L00330 [Kazachstania africana CBS 2517]